MWTQRSKKLELLDLGPSHYTLKEYEQCLQKLAKIGRWLGGDRATLQALKKQSSQSYKRLLDVGCGGGHLATKIGKIFPCSQIVGIDINPLAIDYAHKTHDEKNVSFELRIHPELIEPPKSYDVVTCTLVCHHLSDEEIIDFLKRARRVARKKIVINDLHRHPLAYWLFKAISPIVFNNRLVLHDGPLSILRAFRRKDWEYYLQEADIPSSEYKISWKWAFIWLVEIDCHAE